MRRLVCDNAVRRCCRKSRDTAKGGHDAVKPMKNPCTMVDIAILLMMLLTLASSITLASAAAPLNPLSTRKGGGSKMR